MKKPKIKSFKELVSAARESLDFYLEGAKVEVAEAIFERLTSLGLNKRQLAKKMGTSTPYITKLLSGDTNYTLSTMVKVAKALNSDVRIHFQPFDAITTWNDIPIKNKKIIFSQSWTLRSQETTSISSVFPSKNMDREEQILEFIDYNLYEQKPDGKEESFAA